MTSQELVLVLVQQLATAQAASHTTSTQRRQVMDGSLTHAVLEYVAGSRGIQLRLANSAWLPQCPPPPAPAAFSFGHAGRLGATHTRRSQCAPPGPSQVQAKPAHAWLLDTDTHAHVPLLGVAMALNIHKEVRLLHWADAFHLCSFFCMRDWLSV